MNPQEKYGKWKLTRELQSNDVFFVPLGRYIRFKNKRINDVSIARRKCRGEKPWRFTSATRTANGDFGVDEVFIDIIEIIKLDGDVLFGKKQMRRFL